MQLITGLWLLLIRQIVSRDTYVLSLLQITIRANSKERERRAEGGLRFRSVGSEIEHADCRCTAVLANRK